MQPTRRRPPPPWERSRGEPIHPLGPARRRFPEECRGAAYEGRYAAQRYRRAYDGAGDRRAHSERRVSDGLQVPRRRRGSVLDQLRRNPVRHGLIGLSVAGAATPLAISRMSTQRTDPSHEQLLFSQSPIVPIDDDMVGQAWRAAEEDIQDEKVSVRDTVIADKLERYKELGLERELAETIYDLALQEDIDPDIAFGLVRTESEFKTAATSHVGAIGLTQLMPKTAAWFKKGVTVSQLRDPETNLQIGFRYLNELLDKYDGDQRLALLAYNRGPGTVDRVLKRGGDPDNGYADAVISGEGVGAH